MMAGRAVGDMPARQRPRSTTAVPHRAAGLSLRPPAGERRREGPANATSSTDGKRQRKAVAVHMQRWRVAQLLINYTGFRWLQPAAGDPMGLLEGSG